MTVSSTVNREQYATDGVTTAFTIHFPFFDDTDVNAIFVSSAGVSTTLALNTDFTVTGGNGAGGSLTTTGTLSPLATGGTLTVYREIPFTQETDYVEDDPLPADSLEGDIDRSVMRDQQLKDAQDRALTFPVTIDPGVSAELPLPEAGTFLGWNDAEDALENKTIAALGALVKSTNSQAVAGSNDTDYMTAATTKAALQGAEYDTGSVSTDAGATEGPTNELYRDSASPANSDLLGVRSWAMRSSTAVKRVVAKILARIVDVTNASEDAALDFYTIIAGTLARRFSLGAGIYADGVTGGDKGAGTGNFTGLYVNGVTVGKLVNRYYSEYATNADITTVLPTDDTTPAIAEGAEIHSVSVTTTSATQRVRVRFHALAAANAVTDVGVALFRGTTCVFATATTLPNSASSRNQLAFEFEEVPGSAASFTYSVRIGPGAAGTIRLNGSHSGRWFNGLSKSTLVFDVIEP